MRRERQDPESTPDATRGGSPAWRGAWPWVAALSLACAESSEASRATDSRTADSSLQADSSLRASGSEPPVRRLTNSEYVASIRSLFQPLDLDISTTALPSAVAVDGFDNHIDLSAAYPSVVESYRLLALDVSTRVWQALELVSGCEATQQACVRAWLAELGARTAWRTDTAATVLSAFDPWSETLGLEHATRLSIQLLLLSPDFTYAPRSGNIGEGEWTPLEARPLARRMALLLWNEPPDAILLQAADQGELDDADGVRTQALRMLDDERARTGMLRFYEQLFEWNRVAEASLDPDVYLTESPHIANDEIVPRTEEFTGEYLHLRLQPAIRAESELFVTHHLFEGEGTLAALLTATDSFATWDLALLVYGLDIDASGEPVRVLQGPVAELQYPMFPIAHDSTQRAGLLTLAAFLHGHAGPVQPSPVRRGAFVMSRLLCTPPAAPPDDVPPLPESDGAEPITNRERFAEHTDNPACQTCHLAMDSIGFTFEGYDSLGAVRTLDAGQPIDSSGALFGTDRDGPLLDAVDLAQQLAASRTVHDCHVRQWFRHAFGRTDLADDDALLGQLQQSFWDSQGNLQELVLSIVSSDAFRLWRAPS